MQANRISGMLFVALGAAIFVAVAQWSTQELLGDPGPKLMPQIVAAVMVLLGALLAISSDAKAKTAPPVGERGGLLVLLIAAGLALGYTAVFVALGFTLSTGIYLFGAMALLGPRLPLSFLTYGAVAVAASIGLGLLFRTLLGVPLPGVLV